MNISKEQADKVIRLTEYLRAWFPKDTAVGENLRLSAAEIISIMRGLADGELGVPCFVDSLDEKVCKRGVSGCRIDHTSPQAAPLQSETLAQAAQAPDRLPSGGKPIEAPAPQAAPAQPPNCGTSFCSCVECVMEPAQTEAQEREEFEAIYEGDALACGLEHSNWFRRDTDGDYELHNVSTAWEYFRKGRAGRKG